MSRHAFNDKDLILEHINCGPDGSAVRLLHVPTQLSVSIPPQKRNVGHEQIQELARELARKVTDLKKSSRE